jgi:hypothetical protein
MIVSDVYFDLLPRTQEDAVGGNNDVDAVLRYPANALFTRPLRENEWRTRYPRTPLRRTSAPCDQLVRRPQGELDPPSPTYYSVARHSGP